MDQVSIALQTFRQFAGRQLWVGASLSGYNEIYYG